MLRSTTLPLLALLALTGQSACARPPVLEKPQAPSARARHFSDAVRAGDMLYLSGQIGTDAADALVPGGVIPETRQTLENIRAVLERSGSSLDRVVKCTVLLVDMVDWAPMNEVYVSFFPRRKPARTTAVVRQLARDARVEVECWATVP